MTRGADILATSLQRFGVRRVFALSGNHVMPVFDALLATDISIIHVRQEAACVHMADAWGRLTGEAYADAATGAWAPSSSQPPAAMMTHVSEPVGHG